ncbi:MAG: extracellular solute-binding protein [Streptosporangiaceae bacterium]|jgi:putative spermidine/putrescine transport system substrate-binding protein
MGFDGVFQTLFTEKVIDPFEAKYPNVKVKYLPIENSGQVLAAMKTQASNPDVDVALMDKSVAISANAEGLFGKLNPSIVTNLSSIESAGQTADDFGPALTFDSLALLYNPTLVKTAPTSWDDLWDSAYKGKVVMTPADTRLLDLLVVLDHMDGTNYKTTIAPALSRLKALAPSVETWDPEPDVYTPIVNGQGVIGIGWNARGQIYYNQSGGKLKPVLPAQGTVYQINTINLSAHSQNKLAAETFINYALSPQAQAAFDDVAYYSPTNVHTVLSANASSRVATAKANSSNIIPLDEAWMATHEDTWEQELQQQVIG